MPNRKYLKKQLAICLNTSVPQSTADDALWRIASHLQGVVDGLESISEALTQNQVEMVRGYLLANGYVN